MSLLDVYSHIISSTELMPVRGKVQKVVGLTIQSQGPQVSIGDLCIIRSGTSQGIEAEVVGFEGDLTLLMPLGSTEGIGPGAIVEPCGHRLRVRVGNNLLGRVIDALGRPMDGLPLETEGEWRDLEQEPPNPLTRQRISEPLVTGVRAIDGLLTVGRGQRVGIFAGSGVGKSTLLGMIARASSADVNVIALVGERGREVREFIEKDLGEEGLARSVLVVATSDQPALIRTKAAMLATSIAEYYRDQGLNVMFMMDSVTRYATALREIGLAAGEPPATRGYTPSVFAALPRLLERTGNSDKGSITAIYTVLVEGDDMDEPVADTVRGILDGHIVLSRQLADKGHFPAIDPLRSVSRVMPDVVTMSHLEQARKIKEWLASYQEVADLINIGAYQPGSSPKTDEAIAKHDAIITFLRQWQNEASTWDETTAAMATIVAGR